MKIDKAKYQGYLWYSDKTSPTIIDGDFELEIDDPANPFIVEGQLWDEKGQTSISIKYVDGSYICRKYDLNSADSREKPGSVEWTEVTYLPNRMSGVNLLKFRQYWRAEEDPLCCGMPVLKPAELVFTGFEK